MLSRRTFVGSGLAAIAAGMSTRRLAGCFVAASGGGPGLPLGSTSPILDINELPSSIVIGGVPFAPTWFGDLFPKNLLPFHQCESCLPTAAPDESVEIAVIGGGLSGLASAWLLRDRKPVLFDLRPRFGGNAMGERWNGIPYSLGSAYFIVPDRGSRLESIYRELGVLERARIDTGPFTYEWRGAITQDPCIEGCDPLQAAAVEAYRKLVNHYANEQYPEIPLPARNDAWIRELDTISLKYHLDAKVGPHLPAAYAEAIQAYCFSSFGVGWSELSAAAGWNFIAAEEFGRVVLPGGNAGLVQAMWSQLRALEQGTDTDGGTMLRAGCLVESVRLVDDAKVEVRWREPSGKRRTLHAKHVIMANAKHLVERMLVDIESLDDEKALLLPSVQTVPYLVANVLLNAALPTDIYDLFLLHDRRFPMDANAFEKDPRIVDVVDGGFAVTPPPRRDLLTLYWPLPWHSARFTIVQESDWQAYAELGAAQIRRALATVGLGPGDIAQVRLTRWGHAMPYAQPTQIGGGTAEILRRPLAERIWFVNQDNWMLPAVETCLEEAITFTDAIRARL
jgi:hypothetical protein